MPHLRFSRDKRGYENTFVVHAGGRRKGKGRSRILYWFRTPPGVRVGRAALDEDAIRLIEDHNPDVEFDWTRILKGQGVETAPAPPRERDPRLDRRRRERQGWRPPEAGLPRPAPHAEAALIEDATGETADTAADAVDPLPLVALEDNRIPEEAPPDEPVQPATPAHARIGFEGVARLRARYAEVLARISERIQDSARQEELKTQAERLNPDTWVTDAEVTAGLENYEAVYDALRGAVGGQARRRRGKRRRGGQHAGPPSSAGQNQASDAAGEEGGREDDPADNE